MKNANKTPKSDLVSPSMLICGILTLSTFLTPVRSYYTESLISSSSSSSEAFAPPKEHRQFPQAPQQENEEEQQNQFYSSHHNHPYGSRDETQRQQTYLYDQHFEEPQYPHSQHHSHHYHQHHNNNHHHHQSHHHHNHHSQHIQQEHRHPEDVATESMDSGKGEVVAKNNFNSQEEQQHDGPYYSSHISTNKYGQGHVGNCRLPDSWKGKWFQSGIQNPVLIDSKFIEGKGTCYESSGDKFLFVEKKTCHRCVVINERHRNVLEYKESSFCEEKDSLENLCSLIPGDAQLYSLFRIDAQPIDCPFKGPFLFSYNRGHGVCKMPMSRVDVCTEPSKLLLKYQACPNVPRTESTTEELQCLAEWRDSAYHYLVGKLNYQLAASNEDRYRCFIFERAKDHMIKIAESGDATCAGLSSPTEGARTLTFKKIHESGTKCKFPAWFAGHWSTLNGKMSVRLSHKNSTMRVISDEKGEQYYGLNNQFSGILGSYAGAYTGNPFQSSRDITQSLLSEGSFQCVSRQDISEDHVTIIAQHTQGCTTTQKCINLFSRSRNLVVEMQIEEKGRDAEEICNGIRPSQPFVTLIASGENSRCPHLGKYISTPAVGGPCSSLTSDGEGHHPGHHQGLFHSCGRATIHFHSKCSPHEPITDYSCHGSWEEEKMGFLIASPTSRSSTSSRGRFCFSYSETDEGLQVFSSTESCRRSFSPGEVEDAWAFNLTIDGQCVEAVTGGMGRNSGSFTILLLTCFLQLSSLWMIFNNGVMDQFKVIITSSIPCVSRKLAVAVMLAFSSKTVPVLNSLLYRLRATHNQMYEQHKSNNHNKTMPNLSTSPPLFGIVNNSCSNNSITCYAGGGDSRRQHSIQVRE